jgi:hypothetical protein
MSAEFRLALVDEGTHRFLARWSFIRTDAIKLLGQRLRAKAVSRSPVSGSARLTRHTVSRRCASICSGRNFSSGARVVRQVASATVVAGKTPNNYICDGLLIGGLPCSLD